jgi:hypothetical protein
MQLLLIYGDFMLPRTWTNHYKAISRANFALSVINELSEAAYRKENKTKGITF